MGKQFYKDLDNIFLKYTDLLNHYCKSAILQDYFLNEFNYFFYATIISNFFHNLTQENVKELNLPKGKIGEIKRKYKTIQRDIKSALRPFKKKEKIDEKYYEGFKLKIKKDLPEFIKIISTIEKEIGIRKAKNYLKKKEKEIRELGKSEKEMNPFFETKYYEFYVQEKQCFPIGKDLDKLMASLTQKCLPECSKIVMKELKKTKKEMLNDQRNMQKGFEARLYKRWEEPIDLFECLIKVSTELGESHTKKLNKTVDSTNNYKREALIKIHARALHISNEILVLLKSGYADGANARWRCLYELAVISFFLLDNNNDVSQRYLEHENMKIYKEANDYQACYKKLGYLPMQRKDLNYIKKKHNRLIGKYGREFKYKNGFEWIPRSIIKNPNFRTLEERVRLSKLRPFYNTSSNSIHGGARGFYRLGLMRNHQNDLLLVGSSDYGLADPLQNTAISLSHIAGCLINLEPDYESIVSLYIIRSFVNEICPIAAETQKKNELPRRKQRGIHKENFYFSRRKRRGIEP